MATIAPPPAARTAPALTWDVADGIATVVLDLKSQPVNVISRAVKDEFIACFAALADDPSVKAVAFFSGKTDNFIAGADIEEFVTLSSAAEADRRRYSRLLFGWRFRVRARLSLSRRHRPPENADRLTRGAARHPAGRWRLPAAAQARRRPCGARHDPRRQERARCQGVPSGHGG